MKRKFKLFATVASLCLSVALMAFGVYAASSVEYTVNGSVSYTAQVACTWEVTATYGDGSTNAAESPSETGQKVFVPTDTANTGTWDADMVFGAEENHEIQAVTE